MIFETDKQLRGLAMEDATINAVWKQASIQGWSDVEALIVAVVVLADEKKQMTDTISELISKSPVLLTLDGTVGLSGQLNLIKG